MRILETSKFRKLRKKLIEDAEKEALEAAVLKVIKDPQAGKKLKGDFAHLRSYRYAVKGQARHLIYKLENDSIVFFSFGPRQANYK